MTLDELNTLIIQRPWVGHPKDCIICSDAPPPVDEEIVLRGVVILCERHEASLRERVAAGPTTMQDVLGIVFGPIFR